MVLGQRTALGILAVAGVGLAFAQDDGLLAPPQLPGSFRVSVSDAPTAWPQRVAIADKVSVGLAGSVVDALLELGKQHDFDWVVGLQSADPGKTARFEARDQPLWKALDQLLAVYGYDWGMCEGVIVCWPAMMPARARAEPGEYEAGAVPTGNRLTLGTPTKVADLAAMVTTAREPVDGVRVVDCPLLFDGETSAWGMCARLRSRPQYLVSPLVCAAIGAVVDGCVYRTSAARRLDAALRLLDTPPNGDTSKTKHAAAKARFVEAFLTTVGAQQWQLVLQGGQAEVAFRELSNESAALFLAAVREQEHAFTNPADLSKPWELTVSVRTSQGFEKDGAGKVTAVINSMVVTCSVPMISGAIVSF